MRAPIPGEKWHRALLTGLPAPGAVDVRPRMPHTKSIILDVADLDRQHFPQAQPRAHCKRVSQVGSLVGPGLGEKLSHFFLSQHTAALGLTAKLHQACPGVCGRSTRFRTPTEEALFLLRGNC